MSFEEVAVRFGIGQASVFRWSKRFFPCRNRDKPAVKIDMAALARDMEEQPDAYQHERAARLGSSQRGISDALQCLTISRKKNVSASDPKADEASRDAFRSKIKEYHTDKRSVISVDESGFAHDMPRTHGSAPVGRRCFGQHDWNTKGRINAIGALLNKEFLTVTVVNGSIDADVFHVWLKEELLPELPDN